MHTLLSWDEINRRYPIGINVNAEVISVMHYGIRVIFESEIEGVIPNSEIRWDVVVSDAHEYVKKGQIIYAQVMAIDRIHDRISLSIRRAEDDPWKKNASKYIPEKIVRARVTHFDHQDIILELEDGIIGVMSRSDVIHWESKVEEVLECNDWIEAVVLKRDEKYREIHISMRKRLELLALETRMLYENAKDEHLEISSSTQKELNETETYDQPQPEVLTGKDPLRILVVDNMRDERQILCAILNDLGYRGVFQASDAEQAKQIVKDEKINLVLLDLALIDRKPDSGIILAKILKNNYPELKIILVTGNELPEDDGWEWMRNNLSGVIRKPLVFQDVEALLKRFLITGNAGWSEDPSTSITNSVKFMESISRLSNLSCPLSTVLVDILKDLKNEIDADGVAVISWHAQSDECKLEASFGINEFHFNQCKANLLQSPVGDLIFRPDYHIFNNAVNTRLHGEYYYLRQIMGESSRIGDWSLRSCIAELLPSAGEWTYTLFVFGCHDHQFQANHQLLTRAAAFAIGATIREHWLLEGLANERRLSSLGAVLGSTAHELKGRLSLLEAMGSVSRTWKKIFADKKLIETQAIREEMNNRVEEMSKAQKALINIVDKLLGWIRDSPEAYISINESLQHSIDACSQEAKRRRIQIINKVSDLPGIVANPTEIEQVFFNIILNAIEHHANCRRYAGAITITSEYVPGTERPVKLRFSDTGPGIHSHLISINQWGEEKIFSPLFSTKIKGTGMGLYIVRGLLGNIGATIKVEKTAILSGTTFLVEIPIIEGKR